MTELVRDVVALFVDPRGPYPSRVAEWYDERRDARTYAGSLPVVAHPPCQRWCRLAGLVQARWGHPVGEDGGLFAAALGTLRTWGGVLEHPAYSKAWDAFGLPRPTTGGGWRRGVHRGEWTCYVEQWRYGHRAKKATWLYYAGVVPPPPLRFGFLADTAAAAAGCAPWRDSSRRYVSPSTGRVYSAPTAVISRLDRWQDRRGRLHGSRATERLSAKEAIHSPPEFIEELIMLARWSARDA